MSQCQAVCTDVGEICTNWELISGALTSDWADSHSEMLSTAGRFQFHVWHPPLCFDRRCCCFHPWSLWSLWSSRSHWRYDVSRRLNHRSSISMCTTAKAKSKPYGNPTYGGELNASFPTQTDTCGPIHRLILNSSQLKQCVFHVMNWTVRANLHSSKQNNTCQEP